MADQTRRTELAAFLRARRDAVSPGQVGLPNGSRRRTPGLRREEVAALADVGVTWYTFLEQGRPIKISADALRRIADALRLTADETRHLFLLAGRTPPSQPVHDGVPGQLGALIAGMDLSPCWLVSSSYDVVDWNRAASAVWVDLDTIKFEDRNLVWLTLTHPSAPLLQNDWDRDAQRMMAALRARQAESGEDPRFAELIDRLLEASPLFAEWWPHQQVTYAKILAMQINHPGAGTLSFSATTVRPEATPGLRLLIWTPEDATTADRVRGLLDST